MRAGEFGAAARLSPKALRIYAEQGLLVPALVDPVTGYRYYRRSQLPRARLISRLRALDLSLSRIAVLVDLPAEARQAELRAWLVAQEDQVRRRRDLVTALAAEEVTRAGEVRVRNLPERKVLSAEGRLHVDDLDDFITDAQARIRSHLKASGVAADDRTRVHFHGMVTRDSDGPVEVTVAFEGRVEPVGELRVRVEPAMTEAYLPVSEADAGFPGILRVYDAIERWMDENNRWPVASPIELYPGTDGAFLDVCYPLSETEKEQ